MVFIFDQESEEVKIVEVKTGISDFDNIEIISGIEEGVKVVQGPFIMVSKSLKNGDKVEEMEKGDKRGGRPGRPE